MTAPTLIRVTSVAEVVPVTRIRRPAPEVCPECGAPAPDHLTLCSQVLERLEASA